MFVLCRLYAFKRRCGMTRRRAFITALAIVLRDFNLRSPR